MVKNLLLITGAAFIATYIPAQLFGWDEPFALFGLQPYAVTHNLFVWQLFTYLFLHWGFFHIIFNLFALWMFGADLENTWGSRRFLFYYLLTGVGAGVINVLLSPSALSQTIGCSGAIYGLLLAYGVLFPDRPIYLYFFIPIKAKWFVILMGVIEFVTSFSQPGSGISHISHLGGMLVGFLYLRGRGLPWSLQNSYQEWRRARLRRKFEAYMRKGDRSDRADHWLN